MLPNIYTYKNAELICNVMSEIKVLYINYLFLNYLT